MAAQAKWASLIEQAAQLANDGGLNRGLRARREQRRFLGRKAEDDNRRSVGGIHQAQIRASAAHGLVVGDAAFATKKFRALIEDQVGGFDDVGRRTKIAIEHQATAARGLQGLARPQVGMDVGAAETVNGLLGIADHGQGMAAARLDEDALEDRPLHVVGVLEFVDQGMAVAAAQGFDERAPGLARIGKRPGHQGKHVGKVEQPRLAFATSRALADERGQPLGQERFQRHRGFVELANRVRQVSQARARGV